MGYFLTIDAGTGSARAVIFNIQGQQVGMGQHEWTHHEVSGVPNSMDFDYNTNWKLIARCIREALALAGLKGSDILAVTATSMREGIILYDKNKVELFGVANVDARAHAQVQHLQKAFPDAQRRFYQESGQTFALGALPRLLWVKEHLPSVYEKTASMNMISDWVLAKLSNVIATDPSNAGTTGIFSLSERTWAPHMAEVVGLKTDIFPPVYETGTIIGQVTSQAAQETGLSVGTPVVMGGGDVQLGSAGLGVVKAGQAAILGGSFWQQLVNIEGAQTDPSMHLRINPHVIQGLSQAEGITFFSGLVMRWFRDVFCAPEKEAALKEGIDAYAYLERMAREVPVGSYGILPIFSDTMNYDTWYHAAPSFVNLSLDPNRSSKAALFRSLQENAAIVSMLNLEAIFAFTGLNTPSITFAGGASKGTLWSQIVADVTGKTVHIPHVTEATALGGAFACGMALGTYRSMEDAASNLIAWSRSYEPNPTHHTRYQEVAKTWQEVYRAQRNLVDRGLTTSMWKAPGL